MRGEIEKMKKQFYCLRNIFTQILSLVLALCVFVSVLPPLNMLAEYDDTLMIVQIDEHSSQFDFALAMFEPLSVVMSSNVVREIAVGGHHTVIIRNDGSLWAWGLNTVGQLGVGTHATVGSGLDFRNIPTQIGTDTNWTYISAGIEHTVAIREDGSLWAWGNNFSGQLGNGSTTFEDAPVQIGTDTNWRSVVAGGHQTMAIREDGSLWAWGNNQGGQLGDGTRDNRFSPVQIGYDTNWESVTTGGAQHFAYTEAIKNDGSLWAWGGGPTTTPTSPERIGTDTWRSIARGMDHTIAIRTDGTLWAWGVNEGGQLGNGGVSNMFFSAAQIGADADWQSVTAGWSHSLAIKNDGRLYAWGRNLHGRLGDGTTIDRYTPQQIGADTWRIVVAGSRHTVAIRSDGSLWTWGMNEEGQLGDGTTTNFPYPKLIIAQSVAPMITSSDNTSVVNTGGVFQITATGDEPIIYSLVGAPFGVTIDAETGLITIADTAIIGTHYFTIMASNDVLPSAIQDFTLRVISAGENPIISTSRLPSRGTIWQAYNHIFEATGSTPLVWDILSGTLPEGLTLDENTGAISGIPVAHGTNVVQVRATNSVGSDYWTIPIRISGEVTGVSINETTSTVIGGGQTGSSRRYPRSVNLSHSLFPLNAISVPIEWRSSNPSVASVNQDGVVTATLTSGISEDVSIIIRTLDGNNYIDSITLTVYAQDAFPVNNSTTLRQALEGGNATTNRVVVLENNINMGNNWIPVNNFQGILDGRGHILHNFSILQNDTARDSSAGLFGNIFSGNVVIRNLGIIIDSDGIVNTDVDMWWNGVNNSRSAGGIIGQVSGGTVTIDNCYVESVGRISAYKYRPSVASGQNVATNHTFAGGFIGQINRNATVNILNSYSNISVEAITRVEGQGTGLIGRVYNAYANAGGLIGYIDELAPVRIENSYSTGGSNRRIFAQTHIAGGFGAIFGGDERASAGGLIGRGNSSTTFVQRSFYLTPGTAQGRNSTTFNPANMQVIENQLSNPTEFRNTSAWNFNNTWQYRESSTYRFPVLRVFWNTEQEIYIHNASDLRNRLIGGERSEGRTYILTSDITVHGWMPVNDFRGTFDGRGHTVTISTRNTRNYGSVGLFGNIYRGDVVIKNVNVIGNVSADVHTNGDNLRTYAGGLVGAVMGGNATIENCSFSGSVRAETRQVDWFDVFSFLAGFGAPASLGEAFISILAEIPGAIEGLINYKRGNGVFAYAGGLVGFVGGNANLHIENSNANGIVHAWASNTSMSLQSNSHSGGLIGFRQGGRITLLNCNVTNAVTAGGGYWLFGGLEGGTRYSGPIIGRGSIESSTNVTVGNNTGHVSGVAHVQEMGDDFEYVFSRNVELFDEAYLNSELLMQGEHFRVVNSSTKIILLHEYLDTLTPGVYTLTTFFTDGTSLDGQFIVSSEPSVTATSISSMYVNDIRLVLDTHYSIATNSGIPVLLESYINTLPNGMYTLTMNFQNGTVIEEHFTIDRPYNGLENGNEFVYSATIEPDNKIFISAEIGYSNIEMVRVFTVTNTGTGAISNLTAELFNNWLETSDFEIYMDLSSTSILPGNSVTIGVRPKNNLPIGVYTDMLVIMGDNNIGLIADFSFTVTDIGVQTNLLAVQASAGGNIIIGTGGLYVQGTSIPITAAANNGYSFNGWTTTNGGTFANAENINTTFTMPDNATTITANFIYTGEYTVLYGDINNDGLVNNADLILMLRYFAQPGIEINLVVADVNGDGVVNNADLVLLMMYFAQPGIILGPPKEEDV
jgi:alpha-tubulin suppressor-like RCC1 family protein